MKLLPLVVLSAVLASCATPLSQPQPRPKNPQPMVVAAMEYQLKDPGSANYKFQDTFLTKTGKGKQWVMNFDINSKNSFGGYTGYERWLAAFADGRLDWTMSYRENPLLGTFKPVAQ